MINKKDRRWRTCFIAGALFILSVDIFNRN